MAIDWVAAFGAVTAKPLAAIFGGALRPNEKSNITASIRQLPAKKAADGASPDNKHAHECLVVFAIPLTAFGSTFDSSRQRLIPPTCDDEIPAAGCNGTGPLLLAKSGLRHRKALGNCSRGSPKERA